MKLTAPIKNFNFNLIIRLLKVKIDQIQIPKISTYDTIIFTLLDSNHLHITSHYFYFYPTVFTPKKKKKKENRQELFFEYENISIALTFQLLLVDSCGRPS